MRSLLFVGALVFIATVLNAPAKEQKGQQGKPGSCSLTNAECKAEAAKKEADRTLEKKKAEVKSMEKQQMKKAEQVRKEAGKGSEQGQAMREEHSRKWWKFWGDNQPAETPAE